MPGKPVARINHLIASQTSLRPNTPSDEQAHNDSRFDSSMEITAWTLIVDNGSTACIVHLEGMKVSA